MRVDSRLPKREAVTCLQHQHEIIQVTDEEVRMQIFALSEEIAASNLCRP